MHTSKAIFHIAPIISFDDGYIALTRRRDDYDDGVDVVDEMKRVN